MYVIAGADPAPSTLVWMSSDGVNQAILVAGPGRRSRRPAPVDRPARARARGEPVRVRPRSPPRSPDRAAPVIPLRDANPTRRTPFVTLAIIIACFIAFAWELGLMASGGSRARRVHHANGASSRPT